jgi:hypothetical protein
MSADHELQKRKTEMGSHKFNVGDVVAMKHIHAQNLPGGFYEIVKQLPIKEGEYEYQIKSTDEIHLRVARESELRKA